MTMAFRLVVVLSILLPVSVKAQLHVSDKQVSQIMTIAPKPSTVDTHMMFSTKSSMQTGNTPYSISILNRKVNHIPPYRPKHYGVFCRIESSIEKKSRISPRFRLGSSAYVDVLEGKL